MNQLLPYEAALNQQWNDLPLPDENMAWADMKRRLESGEKRRALPFWWTGCGGWGLLGLLLLGLGWWIIRPEKWFNRKQEPKTEQVNPVIDTRESVENDTGSNRLDTGITNARSSNDSITDNNQKTPGSITEQVNNFPGEKKNTTISKDPQTTIKTGQGVVSKKIKPPVNREDDKPARNETTVKEEKTDPVTERDPVISPVDSTTIVVQPGKPAVDPTAAIIKPGVTADSVVNILAKDSSTKNPLEYPVVQDKKNNDSTRKNPMIYSAGLGLHQVLPVAGQKWAPYSSSGRKASLADYIPSIYFRATKPGKWFLQSEFRYGAPQHNKELAFRQTIKNDSIQGVIYKTTTTSTLKKTYYHQLPLSFSYYVLPNWSVGVGMQWNNFYAAVAEVDVVQRNPFTQSDTLLSKFIQAIKNDSAHEFRKTHWQGIIQTQYQWKRFTLGARYNFGIQPFINYTLPGQNPREEKNNSLQVFILFELWKSRKK